jgi:hypothetical protein
MGNWQKHEIPGKAKSALIEFGCRLLRTKTTRLESWEMCAGELQKFLQMLHKAQFFPKNDPTDSKKEGCLMITTPETSTSAKSPRTSS